MKKYLILLCVALLIQGCSIDYVQVYKTQSVGIKHTDDIYTFENDTLKIEYSFWADKGIMAFRVYNKTDRPLYIDWRKSNFISNSFKADYWADKTESQSTAQISGQGYIYRGSAFFPGFFNFNSSTVNTTSTTTKPERITFLPPRTYFLKSDFHLKTSIYKDWGENFETRIEPRNDYPKEVTKVFVKKFTKDNTPLDFRNFLTFSFREDFSTEFYIDNEFYVIQVEAMDKRHFYMSVDDPRNTTKSIWIPAERKGKDFYIKAF
jgi:hypothetical protein